MNHLESVKKIVQLRRSDWAREVAKLLESAPDYREIEKVEFGPCERNHLWYIYINGLPVGEPFLTSYMAEVMAQWLHQHRENFNLVIKPATLK